MDVYLGLIGEMERLYFQQSQCDVFILLSVVCRFPLLSTVMGLFQFKLCNISKQ